MMYDEDEIKRGVRPKRRLDDSPISAKCLHIMSYMLKK